MGKGIRQKFVIPRAAATQEKEAKSWQRQKKKRVSCIWPTSGRERLRRDVYTVTQLCDTRDQRTKMLKFESLEKYLPHSCQNYDKSVEIKQIDYK